MEEMNMEIMQMIDDLQQIKHHQKMIGVGDAKADRYGYDFEPDDAFSAEPLGFTETALRLQTEALELFGLIRRVNRFSPLFFRMCGQFERMVSRLGSCCITKAVMEQQGDTFSLLEYLTIDKLRQMAAFNFRKCYAAFMEGQADGRYKPAAFDLSVRWAALDKRLLATADKIEKIKSGKIKADLPDTELFGGQKNDPDDNRKIENNILPYAPKSASLPIDKTAIREAQNHGNPEECDGKEVPVSADDTGNVAAAECANAEDENVHEGSMRDILRHDAVRRADREAYEAAGIASGAELESLWAVFMKRDSEEGFPCLRNLGLVVEDEEPPPEIEEAICGTVPVCVR